MSYEVEFNESDRQAVLLALQKLRIERPGWDYLLGLIEVKLGGQIEWPPYPREICFRCKQQKPGAELLTTETGGRYCLDCIKSVEVCRGCGCTDELACPGCCGWVVPGECSNCYGSLNGLK